MLGSAGFDFVLTAKTKQGMAELHHVLDALNAPPYNLDLTAVTLRYEETWLILTSLDANSTGAMPAAVKSLLMPSSSSWTPSSLPSAACTR